MAQWVGPLPMLEAEQAEMAKRTFAEILKVIKTELVGERLPESTLERLAELVKYNSLGGKLLRLQMTLAAFQHFAPDASSDDWKLAAVLGWIAEIFHGAACLIDDVVDEATLRRNRTCWHRLPGIGSDFIIDSHLLIELCNLLLQHFFRGNSNFPKLLAIYSDVKWASILGESVDSSHTARLPLHQFTNSLYREICDLKTSAYTFYFPIAAALALRPEVELDDASIRAAASLLGFFFQVQDDFIDVFGDVAETGKVGSDIRERKCTWLIATALELADDDQKDVLTNHYGNADDSSVQLTVAVFEQLGMRDVYRDLTQQISAEFNQLLAVMPERAPVQLYQTIFQMLANRRN